MAVWPGAEQGPRRRYGLGRSNCQGTTGLPVEAVAQRACRQSRSKDAPIANRISCQMGSKEIPELPPRVAYRPHVTNSSADGASCLWSRNAAERSPAIPCDRPCSRFLPDSAALSESLFRKNASAEDGWPGVVDKTPIDSACGDAAIDGRNGPHRTTGVGGYPTFPNAAPQRPT